MGGKSKGAGSQTVTQTTDPWAGQQPYIKQLLGEAQRLYGTGVQGDLNNPSAAPSYDYNAYNQALQNFNTPLNITGYNQTGGMVNGYQLSDGSTVPVNSTIGDAMKIGSAYNVNRGAAPTIDQFRTGGGAGATNSLLAPEYYPGQTVASQSPYTQQATGLLANRALSGSPVNAAAQQQITDTLSGKYLDPSNNPGFQQALTDISKAYSTGTAAQRDSAFNQSGAYGGSAYKEISDMQNKAFGDSLNTLAGNMYQQGRNNQLQNARAEHR